jgi:murein DD-endopeptidase MepM/ murein hydrolase activator NlpD
MNKIGILIVAILIYFPIENFAQQESPVNIFHEPTGDGGFSYYAKNLRLAPYQLEVSFDALQNLTASVTLPYYTVVYPGEPTTLFELTPTNNGSTSFRSSYRLTLGDPNATIDGKFVYQLPYQSEEAYRMVQGPNGAYTHQGKYAWDFLMDEGTKVCASRDGVVVTVKEDSNLGGADKSFMPHANVITVMHNDGSFADYVHLQQHGALVEPGDHVTSGQVIGYSGNTGWSTNAHLHFQVYKAIKFGTQTLPARFLLADGIAEQLQEQVVYPAVHK